MTFWTPEIVQRLDRLSKSVGSFGIRCDLGWVLGGFAGTISSWAVPEKTVKNTRKRWFLGIKTTNCRPCHFFTFYSWQMVEIFVVYRYSYDPKLNTLFYFSKSWAVPEKTAKNSRKCDFWLSKPQIVGLATSLLSTHGRYLKFLWYIPKILN